MRRPHRQRGTATVLAIALIALVSVALGALATQMRQQVDDTDRLATGAQLRQMLTIGAGVSARLIPLRDDDVEPPPQQMNVALPLELVRRDGSIKLEARVVVPRFERRITITAKLDGDTMQQTLRYVRGETGWGVVEANFHPEADGD